MPWTMVYQPSASLRPTGLPSPPDRTLPRKADATGFGLRWRAPISICVIWPIFSARVIWASSSDTRWSTVLVASSHGDLVTSEAPEVADPEAEAPGVFELPGVPVELELPQARTSAASATTPRLRRIGARFGPRGTNERNMKSSLKTNQPRSKTTRANAL